MIQSVITHFSHPSICHDHQIPTPHFWGLFADMWVSYADVNVTKIYASPKYEVSLHVWLWCLVCSKHDFCRYHQCRAFSYFRAMIILICVDFLKFFAGYVGPSCGHECNLTIDQTCGSRKKRVVILIMIETLYCGVSQSLWFWKMCRVFRQTCRALLIFDIHTCQSLCYFFQKSKTDKVDRYTLSVMMLFYDHYVCYVHYVCMVWSVCMLKSVIMYTLISMYVMISHYVYPPDPISHVCSLTGK